MEITNLQILLLFIFSSIVGIESILDEFQFHRPIVSCPIIGLILGDLKTGILIGGTLEMIVLGWMNVGASVSPDSALSSIIASIIIITNHQNIGSGIAIAIPLSAIGQILTVLVRTATIVLQHMADKMAVSGKIRKISFIHIFALFLHAMRIAIPTLIISLTTNTNIIKSILNTIPEVIKNGLNISSGIVVVIGYAMVINMMKTKKLMPFFYLGFVITAFSNFNLVGIGLLGSIIAWLYVQDNIVQKNEFAKNFNKNSDNTENELD